MAAKVTWAASKLKSEIQIYEFWTRQQNRYFKDDMNKRLNNENLGCWAMQELKQVSCSTPSCIFTALFFGNSIIPFMSTCISTDFPSKEIPTTIYSILPENILLKLVDKRGKKEAPWTLNIVH